MSKRSLVFKTNIYIDNTCIYIMITLVINCSSSYFDAASAVEASQSSASKMVPAAPSLAAFGKKPRQEKVQQQHGRDDSAVTVQELGGLHRCWVSTCHERKCVLSILDERVSKDKSSHNPGAGREL